MTDGVLGHRVQLLALCESIEAVVEVLNLHWVLLNWSLGPRSGHPGSELLFLRLPFLFQKALFSHSALGTNTLYLKINFN